MSRDRVLLAAFLALVVCGMGAAPARPRPGYLERVRVAEFGTTLVRIAGDVGSATGAAGGRWGKDARHVYSKQQPWNADGTLLLLQNRGGGTPARLLLDGRTYVPRPRPCADDVLFDYRWHPSPAHANILINVDRAGSELSWFDVTTCRKVRSWRLPLAVDYGIGSGEGNPSDDGRYVALGDGRTMFVVDMAAPDGPARTGPLLPLLPCDVDPARPNDDCRIGNLSISPSGRFVDVKFGGRTEETKDLHRIFAVDSVTLALRPQRMAAGSLRCGSFAARTDGWIHPLKHADMARDPFDGDADVIIGGRSCAGSRLGRVVKVRLRDGKVTALSDPRNEAAVSHVSTRNRARPGWAYVGYFRKQGKRFSDEIVGVRLDGSRTVERYGRQHGATTGCYRCESHPVPSPDGRRILFASNWARDCAGDCGDEEDIKAYVIEAPQRMRTNLPPRSPSTERTR